MFNLVFVLSSLMIYFAVSAKAPIYSQNFEVYDVNSSCAVVKLILEVANTYFEDQFSLSVIDESQLPRSAEAFICSTDSNYNPVNIYNDLKLLKFPMIGKSAVTSYPTTEGFFLKASLDAAVKLLETIASHNPQSKTMILQKERNDFEAQEILRKAFHVYKMLKVSVMMMKIEFIGAKYLSTAISLMMYNPFRKTEKFKVFEFKTANARKLCDEMRSFMKQRTRNLHGFALSITMSEYPMTSKAHYDGYGNISHYSYVDGDIVDTMSKLMNFTAVFSGADDSYAFQYPNGSLVGNLAEIEYGRADLAPNRKFITNYNTSNSLFLHPITTSQLSFIIRRRETRKVILMFLFDMFDKPSEAILLFLSTAFPIIYVTVNRLEQNIFKQQKPVDSIGRTLMSVVAIIHNNSTKQSRNRSTRTVAATLMFYSLIMSSLFQSMIVKCLNTNLVEGKITTIQQLIDEGYKIKMPGFVSLVLKEQEIYKVSNMMNVTKQTYFDVRSSSRDLKTILTSPENIAYLWAELFKTNYLNQFFDDETGENLFESVPEIAYEFYLSMMVPKHSPFIESFNEVLSRYIETGIGDYHIRQAYMDNDRIWIKRVREGKIPKRETAIKVEDLRDAFKSYIALNVLSIVAFAVEIFIRKFKKFKKKCNLQIFHQRP